MKYTVKDALEDVIEACGYTESITSVNGKVIMDAGSLPEKVDWSKWLKALRLAVFFNQLGLCVCRKGLGQNVQMHHAMLTRSDLMGMRDDAKNRILHHTYNVILCHPDCHESLIRKDSFSFLGKLYGDAVIEWYEKVPTKNMRRRWSASR